MTMIITLSIHIFIILLYFAFRYYTQKINTYTPNMLLPVSNTIKYILMPLILIILFIIQGFSNRHQLSQKCNIDMMQTAFMTSAIVIFLIFGLIIGLLEAFPALTQPFNNTFGYFLCGMDVEMIRTVVNKIYLPNIRNDNTNILESIINNKAMNINTVGPDTFQMKMLPLKIPEKHNNLVMKYYNMVLRKDLIGTLVLYILAIGLAVIINTEAINGIKCKKTDEDIIKSLNTINLE
jgi:hypothetical protein